MQLARNVARIGCWALLLMLGGNAVEFYGLDVERLNPIASRIGPERSEFRS